MGGGEGGGGATPCYNASVVADARPDSGAAAAAAAATSACPSAADGLALATLWARSQALDPASDPTAGVSFATLATLAARAAAAGALPRAMTPLQAARAVLAGLATLAGGGVCVVPGEGEGDAGVPPPPPPTAWTPPALLPPHAWANLQATATPSGIARASTAAAAAVTALDAARGEGGDAVAAVDSLWLSRRPSRWLPDYDAFWRVTLPAEATACLAGDVPAARAVEAKVESVATRALGTRAHTVRALPRALTTHPAAGPSLPPTCGGPILLAAIVDAVAFRRRLDVGPRADDARAAAAFRAFWGDAAELRRFEDGSIHEAVLWGGGAWWRRGGGRRRGGRGGGCRGGEARGRSDVCWPDRRAGPRPHRPGGRPHRPSRRPGRCVDPVGQDGARSARRRAEGGGRDAPLARGAARRPVPAVPPPPAGRGPAPPPPAAPFPAPCPRSRSRSRLRGRGGGRTILPRPRACGRRWASSSPPPSPTRTASLPPLQRTASTSSWTGLCCG